VFSTVKTITNESATGVPAAGTYNGTEEKWRDGRKGLRKRLERVKYGTGGKRGEEKGEEKGK